MKLVSSKSKKGTEKAADGEKGKSVGGNREKRPAQARSAGKPKVPPPKTGTNHRKVGAPANTTVIQRPAPKPKVAPRVQKSRGVPAKSIRRFLPVLCIAAALCVVVTALAYGVSQKDTIYPHVQLEGIELGGMTLAEATETLTRAGYAIPEDAAVTVVLPAAVHLRLNAAEAGVATSPEDGARQAWNYGRNRGNMFGKLFCWVKGMLRGEALEREIPLKKENIRAIFAPGVAEAREKLQSDAPVIQEETLQLQKGGDAMILDEEEICDLAVDALIRRDFTEQYYTPKLDEAKAKNARCDFQVLHDSVCTQVQNAVCDKETGAATPSVIGYDFDQAEAKRLWDQAKLGDTVTIPLTVTYPTVTTEELQERMFGNCLAQFSTSLGYSSAARVNNVVKACASINGVILNPGEEFSYNGALGQRTPENGYQMAGAYSAGKVVQEYGGGICQVSSTLYYTVLHANLKITERQNHYFGVNYMQAGLDATVSWPSPDFRFVNDREYPVKIEAYVQGGVVFIKIWGTNLDGSYVKMETDSWNLENGYGVQSYRCVYNSQGELVSREKEATSQYHYHQQETETED